MKKYLLYGADVQGIQGFIFKTNELKDIIKASDKVKSICDGLFKTLMADKWKDEAAVINAAGKVRYIFTDEEECAYVVREFPRLVVEYAPGITISQAVVGYDNDSDYNKYAQVLEGKLKAQRNQPMPSTTIGLMGIHRSTDTGLPALISQQQFDLKGDILPTAKSSAVNQTLCNDAFGLDEDGNNYKSIFETDRMNDQNDWVAVVHIDGNGIGKVVQRVTQSKTDYRLFSEDLDHATKRAAKAAFKVIRDQYEPQDKSWKNIPIRPIVLGGDDFTFICRADLALPYSQQFMIEFEKESKQITGVPNGLTACGGIAYVKSSFPFYYAYDLAEQLCDKVAKPDAKRDCGDRPAPSCLAFHKVQDSFYVDIKEITARELTSSDQKISFQFGPYYLHPKQNRWQIQQLRDEADLFSGKLGNAVKSRLRNWMSLLLDCDGQAAQDLLRIKSIISDSNLLRLVNETTDLGKYIFETTDHKRYSKLPIYDILALHTVNNQKTKKTKTRS